MCVLLHADINLKGIEAPQAGNRSGEGIPLYYGKGGRIRPHGHFTQVCTVSVSGRQKEANYSTCRDKKCDTEG